ncbi:MAG TPA: NAD-dependent epimerase/dehydratase family protein [Desulfatiglandales bacterium]|nr:NAD-dependent epimerase/dehydratase family protein [Desulfatiglandales bacterium]
MDSLIKKDSLEIIERLAEKNQNFAGKKVLLTGAAGFLGIQFVHFFLTLNDTGVLERPVAIWAYDSFIRGQPAWVKVVKTYQDVHFINADITRDIQLENRFDFIIHAASIASPSFYRKYPIETMDANVIGLRRLLNHAIVLPPRSMLFFSSSEIYGDPTPEAIPTPESYRGNVSCTGPRACYDESKRFGETLCVNFQKIFGVPIKIVRPFNNYGPGLKISDRRAIPDFFRDVLSGRNIVLYSDGTPTRTFCYISDAMVGYLLTLLSEYDGEAFNIGVDGPEIEIQGVAKKVIEVSGKPLKVVVKKPKDADYLKDNPIRRCPDISKARSLLGYSPAVDLDEGLIRSYAWYTANASSVEG